MKEPTLELNSRAASNLEAHHCVNGPYTGRNCGGRQIIKKKTVKTIEMSKNWTIQ